MTYRLARLDTAAENGIAEGERVEKFVICELAVRNKP